MRFFIFLLIFAAFALLELFIGGTRLLYAIPSVICFAAAAVVTLFPQIRTSQRATIPALCSILFFAAYIGIRNRCSEVEYIGRLQFFILIGCLLIYLLFTLVLTKPGDRKVFFIFLGIMALLQIVPALIQFTQKNQWMPLSWAQRLDAPSWRASGFFICPNHFAGFLEVMALIATSYAIWGRISVISRVLSGYTALVCLIGVAISGSRGGYLSITSGALVLLILSCVAWCRMKKGGALIPILIALGIFTFLFAGTLLLAFENQHLGERVTQINDPENCRVLLWSAALDQFHLSPIWGTGGFSYLYFGRLFRDPSIQNDPIHVHNDYLQILADYGSVGFSLLAILLIVHITVGISGFRKLSASTSRHAADLKSDRLAINIGALSAVAAYLVHSVVDFNMQTPQNAFMMAVVLGVLANPGAPNESEAESGPSASFRVILRYCLPLIGLGIMIYGIPMIRGEYLAERARVALRDGHQREALDFAREGTRLLHDNPELYYYEGESALQLVLLGKIGKSDSLFLKSEAVNSFASGLKLFPYDSSFALKSAQALAAAGDHEKAVNAIDYAERIDPNNSLVTAYRGMIDYAFGLFAEAKLCFEEVEKSHSEEAQAIARRGLKAIEEQDRKKNIPSD
ncbi:MAG: O-antigen ligase family protein [bacterium]